jgi:hypothetical protein
MPVESEQKLAYVVESGMVNFWSFLASAKASSTAAARRL